MIDKIDVKRLKNQIKILKEESLRYPQIIKFRDYLPICDNSALWYMVALNFKKQLPTLECNIENLTEDSGIDVLRTIKQINEHLLKINDELSRKSHEYAFLSGV